MNCSATVLRMNFLLLKKQLLVVQLSKIRLACANSVPWAGHEPVYPPGASNGRKNLCRVAADICLPCGD